MKLRKGFVSNSSTTSFTCDICGYELFGFDWDIDFSYHLTCINGHEFCRAHSVGDIDRKIELVRKYLRENNYYYITDEEYISTPEQYYHNVDTEHCPICNYKTVKTTCPECQKSITVLLD